MRPDSPQKLKIERIIALKRYEQPPPGYFHLLPDHILNRIELGDEPSSFWEKLWPNFTFRPSLAYALGLTVCGAMTAVILYVPGPADAKTASTLDSQWAMASTANETAAESSRSGGLRISDHFGSTFPVSPPQAGETFLTAREARAIPVSVYIQP